MPQTFRTSLILPATLHQRLLISAQQEHKPISKLIREILDKALVTKENVRVKQMYNALDKLDSVGSKGVTNASTTINETLYGEHGAWSPQEQ